MRREDAIRFFGTQEKLASALGCAQSTVAGWKPERIPLNRAMQLQKITRGRLKVDLDLYLGKRAA